MNRLSLNYTSLGEGEVLLVIHGLFGSSRNWQSLSRQFALNFRVITLDLRNHGDSFHDALMDYELMANDVLDLMDRLGIPSAHVLGHSMGGKVAMKLCNLYPERVKKLVVADIAPVIYQHDRDDIIDPVLALKLSPITNRKEADAQLEKLIPDQRIRAFLLQNLAFREGKAYWKINWASLRKNMPLIIGFEDIRHWKIENPCLFIRGGCSDYVKDDDWKVIQQHFVHVELVTLKDAGHWLHAEQPAAFMDAVVKFLTSRFD